MMAPLYQSERGERWHLLKEEDGIWLSYCETANPRKIKYRTPWGDHTVRPPIAHEYIEFIEGDYEAPDLPPDARMGTPRGVTCNLCKRRVKHEAHRTLERLGFKPTDSEVLPALESLKAARANHKAAKLLQTYAIMTGREEI